MSLFFNSETNKPDFIEYFCCHSQGKISGAMLLSTFSNVSVNKIRINLFFAMHNLRFFLISVTVTHTILDAIFTNWYLPASCVDYTGTDL